jgi:hypothetical protein
MKKNILPFLPALLLCFSIFSCRKDSPTIINGTVIDKFTGVPIDGAIVNYIITHERAADGSANAELKYVYSDNTGKFFIENILPISIFTIEKNGYITKGGQVKVINEEINDITVKMVPNDGLLSLKVENLLGVHDTIYLAIFSPILKSEISISGGKVELPIPILMLINEQSFSQNIPLASEQDVTIYWDFKPITYSTAFQSLATIVKNDTVYYNISY